MDRGTSTWSASAPELADGLRRFCRAATGIPLRGHTRAVRSPRILAVASAVELGFRYGCTPAWWQLWKGLAEAGVDLIVTPYRGRPVDSPWWRTAPNPCYREGEAFAAGRELLARLKGDRLPRRAESDPGDTDRFVREAIWRWVTPRWRRHLDRLVERERRDAVIVFTVPMSHLRGIPGHLRERYGVPVVFYDGDVPMSLPEFGGMDTGFNYYYGADPSEYDVVVANSEGGLKRLLELGARRAEAVFWGADPEFFSPRAAEKEQDVRFALGGGDFRGDTGRAQLVGDVPFNVFPEAISAARVNLNITRRPHATVPVSSTARPFELASCGAAIVSNPYDGVERWFEPGRELLVVSSAEEAVEAYRELLDDPGAAEAMGARARERVLDEHTYVHRARRLLQLIGVRDVVHV